MLLAYQIPSPEICLVRLLHPKILLMSPVKLWNQGCPHVCMYAEDAYILEINIIE